MSKKTFKFRLYPTGGQEQKLERQLTILQFVYNRLLEQKRKQYKENKISLSAYDLNMLIRKITNTKEVHSQALQNLSTRITKGYETFFALRKQGIKAGLPRFRKRKNYTSITFPQPHKLFENNRLVIPKIGLVAIRIHRKLSGKTKTLTIEKIQSGKWFACFSQEIDEDTRELPKTGKVVGIDLGLNNFIATSDGEFFQHPKPLKRLEKKKKLLGRKLSKKNKGSKNKNKARVKVARLEERIANIRQDYNWKLANHLTRNYDIICCEDLRISNMLKNHRLAKAIADAAWGDFISKLSYLAKSAGRELIKVDPKDTSQMCSNCNNIVPKDLSVRMHRCHFCGLEIDRDLNAARVILKKGVLPERQEFKPVEIIPIQTGLQASLQESSVKQEDLAVTSSDATRFSGW